MGHRSATSTIAVDAIAVDPAGPADAGDAARAGHANRRGRTIRGRMARILALPMAAVVLLLVLVAATPVRDYRESRSTSRSVGVALAVQALVAELQNERGVASLVLGGNESFRNELTRVRGAVDSRRTALVALVASSGDSAEPVRPALQQLDGLGAVRAATDSGAAGRAATFAFYTDRIAALSRIDLGLSNVGDKRLAQDVALFRALQDATEATAQERALLSGVFSAGGFRKGEFVDFAAMRAAKRTAWDEFFSLADTRQTASAKYVLGTGAAGIVDHFEDVAVGAADGRHVTVNPQSWWSAHTTVLDGVARLQEHAGSVIRLRAYDLQREATLRLGGLLLVVLLCIGGSIYLAILASLSVSRPLADLAVEAETVATDRLPAAMRRLQSFDPTGSSVEPAPPQPAPVTAPKRASAEIRSVVSALNHLQEAAYRLAIEQAMQRRATLEALTNLGRRNQNLVRKQLRFISNLEREEMDPAGLANLFELDHLATRMRRNAASLLVLTGASSPGQWTQPAPVADVIRAAISEVEDYRRVALRRVDEVLVSGAVVGSLAHLLSELIENGLRFSPPDSEVEVVGRILGDEYMVAVIDSGVGMTGSDLVEANARLRGEGDFMTTPSRFLGHFVVGRLAEQAGVRVELLPSPVTGVTARIHLAGEHLVRSNQVASGQVISTDRGLPSTGSIQVGAGPDDGAQRTSRHSAPVVEVVPDVVPQIVPDIAPVGLRPVPEVVPVAEPVRPVPVPAQSPAAPAPVARNGAVTAPAASEGVVIDIRDGAPLVTNGSSPAGPAANGLSDGSPAGYSNGLPPNGSGATGAPPESLRQGRSDGGADGGPDDDGFGPVDADLSARLLAAPPPSTPPAAVARPFVDDADANGAADEASRRTRNGLRMRTPGGSRPPSRTEVPVAKGAGAAPVAGGAPFSGPRPWTRPEELGWNSPAAPRPVSQTAAGQLGSRLAALRSGMARGATTEPSEPATGPQPLGDGPVRAASSTPDPFDPSAFAPPSASDRPVATGPIVIEPLTPAAVLSEPIMPDDAGATNGAGTASTNNGERA